MSTIKRRGFAMILAIFVVVLVALGGVLLLSNVTAGSNAVGVKYLHSQAELLATSATEFAVMRAQGFDTTGTNCLNNLNISVQDSSGVATYDINVTIQYSFEGAEPVNNQCNTLAVGTGNQSMMLIDTIVSTNTGANLSTEAIRVHKRTWQKL
ncbi:hypothetical protein [Sulfuricurvum sp.]|uniref:hypothetical protein n=1 Tax=Sulfuricurvum sp. TaxID=2025608 RepID=UPI0026350999|nr:hypothetical protein [Sulfuricurvum sp.]MDD2781753.1 hypothetical protein [Sulfuricurvum sp.]